MVRSLTRRAFLAAGALAALAGFVDGLGFVYLGGYFVSFMTGNSTRASVDLVSGSVPAAGLALILVVAFVAGATAGSAITVRDAVRPFVVMAGVTAFLLAAAGLAAADLPVPASACMALAMGAVNTVFARDGEVSFGITYMTGALVKVGQGIAASLRGRRQTGWLRSLLLWVAIAAGAVAGAGAYRALSHPALWIAAGAAFALTVAAAWRIRRSSVSEHRG